eukprot:TRINITY_DN4020_c1_g1_i1.p1 TRINITY_DN4020_c1_g1~~TRINITY_DN4020_c1_g1_i1.p1  ORF type:complete len:344 (+),score=60.38 TRINITY_DN4020_c1_g1_i1:99-1130(+)
MAMGDLRSSPYGDAQYAGLSMACGGGCAGGCMGAGGACGGGFVEGCCGGCGACGGGACGGGGFGGKGGKGDGGAMYKEKTPTDNLYVSGLPLGADENFVRTLFGAYAPVQQCRVMPSKIPGASSCTALVRFSSVAEAAAVREATQGGTVQGASEALQVMFSQTVPRGVVGAGACSGGFGGDSSWKGSGPSWKGESSWKGCGKGKDSWFGAQRKIDNNGRTPMDAIAAHFQQASILPGCDPNAAPNCLQVSGLPPDCEDVHLYRIFSAFGPIKPHGAVALKDPDGSCKGFGLVSYVDTASMQVAQQTMDGQLLPDGVELKVTVAGSQKAQQEQPMRSLQDQALQ